MANSYVYSTLTSDQKYTNYKIGDNLPVIEGQVFIKGGANVANKKGDTPPGERTEVDENQLKILNNNMDFRTHVANGFIVVTDAKKDPEVMAVDMARKDNGAPIVPEDYNDTDEAKPYKNKK